MMTANPATRYGPVAEQEFDSAPDWSKDKLTAWLNTLPDLDDAEFLQQAASAIYDSALANRFRGNWNQDHCRATAAFAEARRRHEAAGHDPDCAGDTIYSQAFAQVWRGQGHSADAYPPQPCNCGAE